jgi:hypothetical protein
LIAALRGVAAEAITTGQIAYDPRRPRTRGMVNRIPDTSRYTFTEHGLHTAMFLSAVYDRRPLIALAHLADHATSPPLRESARAYQAALENLSYTTGLAAQPHNTTQPIDSKFRFRQPAQHGRGGGTPIRGPIVRRIRRQPIEEFAWPIRHAVLTNIVVSMSTTTPIRSTEPIRNARNRLSLQTRRSSMSEELSRPVNGVSFVVASSLAGRSMTFRLSNLATRTRAREVGL